MAVVGLPLPRTSDLIRFSLEAVAARDTARMLYQYPLTVAGKWHSRSPKRAHAWFSGYAPVDEP
jgi:hypothetical protein